MREQFSHARRKVRADRVNNEKDVRMRKIVFHINSLEQGGAERVITNLAHQFAAEGYEVYIATEWYAENEFQIDKSITRVHVGLNKEEESRGRFAKLRICGQRLRAFIKKVKPDVVVAFCHKANYRAITAALGTGIPVIVSVRTDPVGHYDHWDDKFQIPLLFPRAAGCVFQTEGQRDFFPEKVRKKSRIILNPLNDKYLDVPEPEKRVKEVVQSGRIVDFKNQLMLIRAFDRVHKKHPDYVLKIYGGDSGDGTREQLEELIAERNAGEYVFLMGASDSLEKVLVNASVFAFSSDWEGLPNALLEAMALGLPIVATDCPCGGPRTVMKDGVNGLLVPIKDEEALADGICRLIENPDLAEQLGRKARDICKIANGKAVFEQWQDYIESVCK